MTMVPAQTLSRHHQLYYCGGYVSYCGGSYTEGEEEYYEPAASSALLRRSDPSAMAEDESRTTTTTTSASLTLYNNNNKAAASSSKDVQAEDDAGWLQLSIGTSYSAKTNSQPDATTHPPPRRGGGLVELDLLLSPAASRGGKRVVSQENTPVSHVPPLQLPSFLLQAGAGSSSSTVAPPPPPASPTRYHHDIHQLHQETNWTFRPAVLGMTNSLSLSPTSCSNLASFMPSFARTPFQLHSGGGASLDFRVIDPPRRPHSGIWFSLQASQNQ